MAILSLQRRLSEVGRIRLGQQVETKSGKKRPASLTTFRLTSADKSRIEEAAQFYGGKVTQWDAPSGIKQWEVITEAQKLPVVVPPSAMSFSQYYELWSAGGCQRRCDGITETLSEQPCPCDPDDRQCEIHTRLSVMLRDLSGLGVWRVDTQGFYAAVELQGSVDVISLAAGKGQMLPATLRLDQRQIKRDQHTKNFVVPVLDVEVSPASLLMGHSQITGGAPVPVPIEAPSHKSLTPVPEGGPTPSIADQVTQHENQPSRRRASTVAVPTTGLAPRTAQQAQSTAPQQRYTSRVTDTFEPPADRPPVLEGNPRMCTNPQLTKLGILLNNMGFDKTDEGRAARLDFCQSAIKQLLPDSSIAGRSISSSKELTFAEANALINMLESDERQERERAATEARSSDARTVDEDAAASQPAEPSATEPDPASESVEDAAERIRLARAGVTGASEGVDPVADSPHGPDCEPNCTLAEDEHPPYVPTDFASDEPDASKSDSVADDSGENGDPDQKDDSQLSLT